MLRPFALWRIMDGSPSTSESIRAARGDALTNATTALTAARTPTNLAAGADMTTARQ